MRSIQSDWISFQRRHDIVNSNNALCGQKLIYCKTKPLGKGRWGEVFSATEKVRFFVGNRRFDRPLRSDDCNSESEFAVKKVKLKDRSCQKEAQILNQVRNCSHLVKLRHDFVVGKHRYLVMHKAGKDLSTFLKKNKSQFYVGSSSDGVYEKPTAFFENIKNFFKPQPLGNRLKDDAVDNIPGAKDIFRQVLFGLKQLHERNIVHRDLKPSNIMVGAFGKVTIIDMGTARNLCDGRTCKVFHRGDVRYSPPERFRLNKLVSRRKKNCSEKSDVWAFGISMAEALIGKRVFLTRFGLLPRSTKAIHQRIAQARTEGRISEGAARVLFKALHPDSKMRSTVIQLLNDNYFNAHIESEV